MILIKMSGMTEVMPLALIYFSPLMNAMIAFI